MRHDSFVRRLLRNESGQTLVLAAIMMPVLIGFVGFAIDVGYAFDYKKQMQMAADSGAMAGAIAVKSNPSISAPDLANVVGIDTANNGFAHGSNGIVVTVCRPGVDFSCPTQYTYASGDGAVKVSITQPKSTFFAQIISFNSFDVGATAVASASVPVSDTSNIVILDTICETGLTISGNNTINMSGRIYINSCGTGALTTGGSVIVNAPGGTYIGCNSGGTCGGSITGGSAVFTPAPTYGHPQIPDPLAHLPVPTPTGTNYGDVVVNGGTHAFQPGIYTNIDVKSAATVTFAPGEYFINGGLLNIRGASTATGTDVFFYGYNGAALRLENTGTTVTMSSPTSGVYKGIFWFQERTNAANGLVGSEAIMDVNGTIYISAPGSQMTFTGGLNSGSGAQYTVFVLWKLFMSGGGTFNSDFSGIGGSPLNTAVSGVALSE